MTHTSARSTSASSLTLPTPCLAHYKSTRCTGDSGTGIISAVFGIGVFLSLVLVAVQVTYYLYAKSTVQAAAYDAVWEVTAAGPGGATSGLGIAEAQSNVLMNRLIGRYSRFATYRWKESATAVSLTVHLQLPTIIPTQLATSAGLDSISTKVSLANEVAPAPAPLSIGGS